VRYPGDPRAFDARLKLAGILAAQGKITSDQSEVDAALRLLGELEKTPGVPCEKLANAGFARASLLMQNQKGSADRMRVEEIARIYGYNNLAKSTPYSTPSSLPNDPVFVFENDLRRRLVAMGLTEFLTCDLISPKLADVAHSITPRSMAFLKTTYSKSEEYSLLRTSLLPGLLQVTKRNLDQKNLSWAAFEIGRIHFHQEGRVAEIPMGAILLTGHLDLPHWSRKAGPVDFFDLKGMIESLMPGHFVPSHHLTFHPGRQADWHIGSLVVGSFGELHPALLEKFGIGQRVYYAEFDLLHLMRGQQEHVRVTPLPQFPSSERDWTVPLPLKTPIDTTFNAIHAQASPLLEKVELIDLYLPETAAQKNATFRFTYRDSLKTISFEEVEKEHAKLIGAVPHQK
jgi:phenylalanyl-tRNA synthetase beta chain